MIIRGKRIGGDRRKPLTEFQLEFYEYLRKEGIYDEVNEKIRNGENARLTISENVGGLLEDLRRIFSKNYVGKEKDGDNWIYTIYAGDKKLNKMMHQPLRNINFEKIEQMPFKEACLAIEQLKKDDIWFVGNI